MAYIGKGISDKFASSDFSSVSFIGDGSTTSYTLPEIITTSDESLLIHIDGVKQHISAYSILGNILTFSAPPPNAAAIEAIIFGVEDLIQIHAVPEDSISVRELDTIDGTTGQVLTTDGSGNLSFSSKSIETLVSMGVTSTAAELNILDGVTSTAAELNYVSGVTSSIQTQINGKQPFDATIMVDADIGTNVQAYDATILNDADIGVNIASLSSNTFTATQKFAKGADIASATVLTCGTDGNYFDVTGTTRITSIGTVGIGAVIKLHFDDVLTLTHNATGLILPDGDITTEANTELEFVEYAVGDWRCTSAGASSGTQSKDVFKLVSEIDVEFNMYNYFYWETTDLILLKYSSTVYVFNKTSKTIVNTYVYSGLIAFDVLSDTVAIGCTNSVIFKVDISGDTLTKGTDSSPISTTNGSWYGGAIGGLMGTSITQAFIAINFSGASGQNACSASAIDISGAIPTVGTQLTPQASIQNYQSTTFKSFKKISIDQCIVSYRTSGSAGSNFIWLLRGVGTTLTQGDIVNTGGSQYGYGAQRDIGQHGSGAEGYSSSIFTMTNGRHCYVEAGGATYFNMIMLDIPSGGVAFTKTSANLLNVSSAAISTCPFRIIQGTTDDDIFVYHFSLTSSDFWYYAYFNSPNNTTLTRKSNGNATTGMFTTATNEYKYLPDVFISDTNKITFLGNIGDNSLNGDVTPVFKTFTTNDTTHTVSLSTQYDIYFPGDVYSSHQTPTITQTAPITIDGTSYIISNDYTIKSTDGFLTGKSNMTFSKTDKLILFTEPQSVKVIGQGPFMFGLTKTKFYFLEMTG
jgi:hypothetical protein